MLQFDLRTAQDFRSILDYFEETHGEELGAVFRGFMLAMQSTRNIGSWASIIESPANTYYDLAIAWFKFMEKNYQVYYERTVSRDPPLIQFNRVDPSRLTIASLARVQEDDPDQGRTNPDEIEPQNLEPQTQSRDGQESNTEVSSNVTAATGRSSTKSSVDVTGNFPKVPTVEEIVAAAAGSKSASSISDSGSHRTPTKVHMKPAGKEPHIRKNDEQLDGFTPVGGTYKKATPQDQAKIPTASPAPTFESANPFARLRTPDMHVQFDKKGRILREKPDGTLKLDNFMAPAEMKGSAADYHMLGRKVVMEADIVDVTSPMSEDRKMPANDESNEKPAVAEVINLDDTDVDNPEEPEVVIEELRSSTGSLFQTLPDGYEQVSKLVQSGLTELIPQVDIAWWISLTMKKMKEHKESVREKLIKHSSEVERSFKEMVNEEILSSLALINNKHQACTSDFKKTIELARNAKDELEGILEATNNLMGEEHEVVTSQYELEAKMDAMKKSFEKERENLRAQLRAQNQRMIEQEAKFEEHAQTLRGQVADLLEGVMKEMGMDPHNTVHSNKGDGPTSPPHAAPGAQQYPDAAKHTTAPTHHPSSPQQPPKPLPFDSYVAVCDYDGNEHLVWVMNWKVRGNRNFYLGHDRDSNPHRFYGDAVVRVEQLASPTTFVENYGYDPNRDTDFEHGEVWTPDNPSRAWKQHHSPTPYNMLGRGGRGRGGRNIQTTPVMSRPRQDNGGRGRVGGRGRQADSRRQSIPPVTPSSTIPHYFGPYRDHGGEYSPDHDDNSALSQEEREAQDNVRRPYQSGRHPTALAEHEFIYPRDSPVSKKILEYKVNEMWSKLVTHMIATKLDFEDWYEQIRDQGWPYNIFMVAWKNLQPNMSVFIIDEENCVNYRQAYTVMSRCLYRLLNQCKNHFFPNNPYLRALATNFAASQDGDGYMMAIIKDAHPNMIHLSVHSKSATDTLKIPTFSSNITIFTFDLN